MFFIATVPENRHTLYSLWITYYIFFKCRNPYVNQPHDYWSTLYRCGSACEDMREVFPELKLTRGHAGRLEPDWKGRLRPRQIEHWWLTAPDGRVVDPTACQFYLPWGPNASMPANPSDSVIYDPLDETLDWPTGKCPECGERTWHHEYTCSDSCERSYCGYLGMEYSAPTKKRKRINNPDYDYLNDEHDREAISEVIAGSKDATPPPLPVDENASLEVQSDFATLEF